jgi:hypothetical protein
MTPQNNETLDDILKQLKNGTITQDGAREAIVKLMARTKANYKRRYSDKQGSGPSA